MLRRLSVVARSHHGLGYLAAMYSMQTVSSYGSDMHVEVHHTCTIWTIRPLLFLSFFAAAHVSLPTSIFSTHTFYSVSLAGIPVLVTTGLHGIPKAIETWICGIRAKTTMGYSQAVCHRLVSGNLAEVDHQCSLCLFLTGQADSCDHIARPAAVIPREATATPFSECSFYTCRSATSTLSTSSRSSGSSSSTIKARVCHASTSTSDLRQHSLRRRQSPTELSLRELHRRQAQQSDIRERRSEEKLQRVYERQILQYLNSNMDLDLDSHDLWTINE